MLMTVIILIALAGFVALAIRHIIRSKKTGGCAGCPGCGQHEGACCSSGEER